jgi:putative transposase
VSRARFSTSQVFHWDGIPYMIQRLLADQGKVILENLATGATLQESLTTLVQAWGEGSLQFVISSAPSAEPARQPLDLASYPEHLVAIARWRLSVIAPLLDLRPRSRRDVERHVERMREEQPLDASASLDSAISVASVYRWIKNYEASGRDILALIPDTRKRGGKGESRLADEAEAMVNAVINDLYFTRSRVTIDDLHHELARRIKAENAIRMPAEQLPVPSRRTVARRVEAQDAQERFAARHGARAANREWRQYGVGPRPTHPLERVEIDHTRLDLLLFDPQDELVLGRPTITYCLDVATRFPLGIYVGFEPPSYYAVMACLQEAILPKSSLVERYGTEHEWLAYGLPQTLVVDNGPEFRGHDLDEACACLGITLDATPIAAPHYKGGVERVFRTLNTGLIHKLPGSTFSSLRDRGDYASEKHAALSLDDFYRVLMIHTVDVYALARGHGARFCSPSPRQGRRVAHPPGAQRDPAHPGVWYRVEQPALQHGGIGAVTPEPERAGSAVQV